MNTLHLKYALEVEKTGSITRAADNLYMGQPSLSKAIKELEETFGIEIFKRSSKGMVPTEDGAQFLQHARKILTQLDKMERIAKDNKRLNKLKIALPRSSYLFQAAFSFLQNLSIQQKTEASDLNEMEISESDSRTNVRRLIDGECNFAIIRIPANTTDSLQDYCMSHELKMETIWIFQEKLVLSKNASFPEAFPSESRISKERSITSEQLKDFWEISFPNNEDPPFYNFGNDASEMSKSSKDQNKTVGRLIFPSQAQALLFLSRNPNACLKSEPLPAEILEQYGLSLLDLNDAKSWQDVLLYPAGYRFCTEEHAFIDQIYQQKNRIAL